MLGKHYPAKKTAIGAYFHAVGCPRTHGEQIRYHTNTSLSAHVNRLSIQKTHANLPPRTPEEIVKKRSVIPHDPIPHLLIVRVLPELISAQVNRIGVRSECRGRHKQGRSRSRRWTRGQRWQSKHEPLRSTSRRRRRSPVRSCHSRGRRRPGRRPRSGRNCAGHQARTCATSFCRRARRGGGSPS